MSDEKQAFGILGRTGQFDGPWNWYRFDYAEDKLVVSAEPVFPWNTVHMAQQEAMKLMKQEPDLWTTQVVIQPDGWGPNLPYENNTTTGEHLGFAPSAGGNW
ncbi:hypothetical protein LCGC14_0164410 [marine sediment metagenome]|uniref:Uncharacterized protein n=1 Tax=marine sediment metagenome TaxID=412755 RepID=A0A0F9VAN0_9ZZZZ